MCPPCPRAASWFHGTFPDTIFFSPTELGFYEGVARTVRAPCKVSIYAFSWALFSPRFQAQRHQVKNPPARQKKTPGIIQRPLATIHKHLGTPSTVVCGGPLRGEKSPETSERCRAARAPRDNTLHGCGGCWATIQACRTGFDVCSLSVLWCSFVNVLHCEKGKRIHHPALRRKTFFAATRGCSWLFARTNPGFLAKFSWHVTNNFTVNSDASVQSPPGNDSSHPEPTRK